MTALECYTADYDGFEVLVQIALRGHFVASFLGTDTFRVLCWTDCMQIRRPRIRHHVNDNTSFPWQCDPLTVTRTRSVEHYWQTALLAQGDACVWQILTSHVASTWRHDVRAE